MTAKGGSGNGLGPVMTRIPDVRIAKGATLKVSSAEQIGTLSGEGRVEIAEMASPVATNVAWQVNAESELPLISSVGSVDLCENGSIVWESDYDTAGWVELVHAEGGIVGLENLSGWSVTGRNVQFKLSADGKSILANSNRGGLMLILK